MTHTPLPTSVASCCIFTLKLLCTSAVRWGSREEAQASPWRVLLHTDISDRRCPEEASTYRLEHVHAWRSRAHLSGQDTLQSGELIQCLLLLFLHNLSRISFLITLMSLCTYYTAVLLVYTFTLVPGYSRSSHLTKNADNQASEKPRGAS